MRRLWAPEEARERTVRSRRFKLVERPRPAGGYRRFLYDLEADPRAEHDVSDRYPQVMAELQQALEGWTAELPAGQPPPQRSDEELEALRTLGYID